ITLDVHREAGIQVDTILYIIAESLTGGAGRSANEHGARAGHRNPDLLIALDRVALDRQSRIEGLARRGWSVDADTRSFVGLDRVARLIATDERLAPTRPCLGDMDT